MFRAFLNTVLSVLLTFSISAQSMMTSDKAISGFTSESSTKQKSLEKQFDASLKRENLREWLKRLSARPHHVGSAYDKDNAEYMLALFKSWGYEAQIEQFDVLFPTPKTRLLEMTAPEKFTAKISEPELKEDATSNQQSEQLPVYNAYSIDGDVTAPLVYVNYGVPADYEELEKRGVDVKGKIVIARYGGSWRGIKPKVAAEHGAVGCLIYSDPRNDGYYQGDVYPKGAYRSENGAQRGSVVDMPTFPGDPLTPGIGAVKGAKRLALKDASTLTKIPVMPISYSDALPMLKTLEGAVVPENWRGALPITYHYGGTERTKVHLKLEFNWDTKTIYDVVAKMKGAERSDEWIIRGNHHDAWVNGANDPLSGQVAMLEEARAISELAKSGWKPKRTIIFCAWDGEEPGLLGSTEWVETHADELQNKAAVYINSDSNGRGFLGVGGSHTLEKFVNEVARDVTDPQTKISVESRWRANEVINGGSPNIKKEAKERADLRIEALGSGSDFTPFLQHLGIASLNLGYGGEDGGGSYHSVYDSFDHYTRFGDPNFDYGIALAQTAGRMTIRLADADVLPFEFTNFADTIGVYVKEITTLADQMREDTKTLNKMIADGTLKAVQDPTETFIVPKPKSEVPFLNFAPLQNALNTLQESAKNYQQTAKNIPSAAKQPQLDALLMKSERALLNNNGLPRRDWFKHQIYAPGFYTGYGVKTIPSVREAIEQRDWKEANEQILVVSKTIENFAAEIDKAARLAQ